MFKTEALQMIPLKTIKYKQRLGDILRCLPACKYLADSGNSVAFDCFEQYNSVFDLVSYAKPLFQLKGIYFDKGTLDLEIWPNRYEEFRKSKKNWVDFIYSNPEIAGADKYNIILDKLGEDRLTWLPEKYALVAPFGISQAIQYNPLTIIQNAIKLFGIDYTYVLCPPEVKIKGLNIITAKNIEEMAKAIRDAEHFWAINSAPIILASAVRKGKESRFYPQTGEYEQDNVFNFEGLMRMD